MLQTCDRNSLSGSTHNVTASCETAVCAYVQSHLALSATPVRDDSSADGLHALIAEAS